jgi:hypothetical protein
MFCGHFDLAGGRADAQPAVWRPYGLIVLGALAVLIATLSTIGIFLRLRTASLIEIQLRLAALEEILTRKSQE